MSKRIDYEQIAAKTDYAALDKKLEQLAQHEPPKSRKSAVDLLEPLRERLLALHRKGWNSQQIADELKAAGVPVSVARVRECLNHWTSSAKKSAKRRSSKPEKRAPAPSSLTPTVNPPSRSKMPAGDHLSGLNLS